MSTKRTELDRQIEYQRQITDEVKGIFAHAVRAHLTHAAILAEVETRIWEHHLTPKLRNHVRSHISGYVYACFDMMYMHLFWGTAWNEEVLPLSWDNLPEECKQALREDKLRGAHYYIGTQCQY